MDINAQLHNALGVWILQIILLRPSRRRSSDDKTKVFLVVTAKEHFRAASVQGKKQGNRATIPSESNDNMMDVDMLFIFT